MGTDDITFVDFYNKMIVEATNWWEVNGWGSKRSQYRRFTAAYEAMDLRMGDCLVDIGCGTGDFSQFLWEKGIDVCYHGFDLLPQMVKMATDKHGPKFNQWDIFDRPVDVRSQWSIAIGTVGALADLDEEKRWKHLAEMMMNMSATVERGFAFTMLTQRNKPNDVDSHHWLVDEKTAIGRVLDLIPPQYPVRILMDYHPHELMFVISKDGF